MKGKDCPVNADSFINALNYLKNQYQLDYRANFLSSKLTKADQLTMAAATHYLEELNFSVKPFHIKALDSLELQENELLFCFDHEHDIIILNHNSDLSLSRSAYSTEYPILLLSSDTLQPKQGPAEEHKDLAWFFRQLTGKDGVYLIITGLITNLLMYVVPIYNMNVFDKVLPHGFMGILSSLIVIAVFLVAI